MARKTERSGYFPNWSVAYGFFLDNIRYSLVVRLTNKKRSWLVYDNMLNIPIGSGNDLEDLNDLYHTTKGFTLATDRVTDKGKKSVGAMLCFDGLTQIQAGLAAVNNAIVRLERITGENKLEIDDLLLRLRNMIDHSEILIRQAKEILSKKGYLVGDGSTTQDLVYGRGQDIKVNPSGKGGMGW
jgi:hypothetical protein